VQTVTCGGACSNTTLFNADVVTALRAALTYQDVVITVVSSSLVTTPGMASSAEAGAGRLRRALTSSSHTVTEVLLVTTALVTSDGLVATLNDGSLQYLQVTPHTAHMQNTPAFAMKQPSRRYPCAF